jgi:hypothetical protein
MYARTKYGSVRTHARTCARPHIHTYTCTHCYAYTHARTHARRYTVNALTWIDLLQFSRHAFLEASRDSIV